MQSRLPYNATLSRRTQDLNTIPSRNSMVSSALLRQAVGLGACSGTPREMQFERLHHLGTRLRSRVGLRSMAAEALLSTVSVAQADAGILQLYDLESASSQLVAQHGVDDVVAQALGFLSEHSTAAHLIKCCRSPVSIEGFAAFPGFKPHVEAIGASGIRRLQIIRFRDRKRELTGITTTCFREIGCAVL